MKKHRLLRYFILILFGLFLYQGTVKILEYYIPKNKKIILYLHPEITGKEGKKIPNFNVLLPDSTTYYISEKTSNGKAWVFIYFSPYCPFCESEMKEIKQNASKMGDVQFMAITPFSLNEMKAFRKRLDLEKYPNIHMGIDYTFFWGPYFQANRIPFTAIYGKQGTLNAAFVGNVPYQQILAVLKN